MTFLTFINEFSKDVEGAFITFSMDEKIKGSGDRIKIS